MKCSRFQQNQENDQDNDIEDGIGGLAVEASAFPFGEYDPENPNDGYNQSFLPGYRLSVKNENSR